MTRDIREGDWAWHRDRARNLAWTKEPHRCRTPLTCNHLGCHLVARRERLAEVWPTDEAFRRFAAEVADAVQAAMADGWTIGYGDGRCCPLGALGADVKSHTSTEDRGDLTTHPCTGQTSDQIAFRSGFDAAATAQESPYYRLGQAYRRRFVTGVGDQS